MRFPRSWSLFALLCLICFQFSTPHRSYADTYNIVFLDSDSARFFAGMDDAGHVVLDEPNIAACGGSAVHCYETFLNGVPLAGFSSTLPSYTWDNGTPCAPSVPGGSVEHGVCNNGLDAFTGFLTSSQVFPGLYVGPSFDLICPNSEGRCGEGLLYMNSLGDIVFDDHFSEGWYEAIRLDTLPAPEPSSLLLLATGFAVAAFVLARRRLVTQ